MAIRSQCTFTHDCEAIWALFFFFFIVIVAMPYSWNINLCAGVIASRCKQAQNVPFQRQDDGEAWVKRTGIVLWNDSANTLISKNLDWKSIRFWRAVFKTALGSEELTRTQHPTSVRWWRLVRSWFTSWSLPRCPWARCWTELVSRYAHFGFWRVGTNKKLYFSSSHWT